jgi:hypothetical protein
MPMRYPLVEDYGSTTVMCAPSLRVTPDLATR